MMLMDFVVGLRIGRSNDEFFDEDSYIKDFVKSIGGFIGSYEDGIKRYSKEEFDKKIKDGQLSVFKDKNDNNIYASKWAVNELDLKYNFCGTYTWSA